MAKRKLDEVELPPLPALFYESNKAEKRDSASDHQGRVRQFAHVEGNYPTFVYIPVETTSEVKECVDELLEKGRGHCADLVAQEGDFHISLSRTFPLREHQINSFVDLLTSSFKDATSFEVDLEEYQYFTNDDHTRSFASLVVSKNQAQICSLIRKVDKVLSEFQRPTFYENPRPHATVAWTLGDITSDVEELEGLLDHECTALVNRVECKIGKWIYCFRLQPPKCTIIT